MNVETEVVPPEPVEDEEDDFPSVRVAVSVIGTGDVHYEAAAQLFRGEAESIESVAEALVKVMLGVASVHSPDLSWALRRRLVGYDGGSS